MSLPIIPNSWFEQMYLNFSYTEGRRLTGAEFDAAAAECTPILEIEQGTKKRAFVTQLRGVVI